MAKSRNWRYAILTLCAVAIGGCGGGNTPEPEKGSPGSAPASKSWGSQDDLMALAPSIELVARRIEYRDEKYKILIPKDAKVEYTHLDARIKIHVDPTMTLEFLDGHYDMEERKKTLTMAGSPTFPFEDDSTLLVEFIEAFGGLGKGPYTIYANLTTEAERFSLRLYRPEGGYYTAAECALALKIARSMKVDNEVSKDAR